MPRPPIQAAPLTTSQLAQRLGCHRVTAYRILQSYAHVHGPLPVSGRGYLIPPEALQTIEQAYRLARHNPGASYTEIFKGLADGSKALRPTLEDVSRQLAALSQTVNGLAEALARIEDLLRNELKKREDDPWASVPDHEEL